MDIKLTKLNLYKKNKTYSSFLLKDLSQCQQGTVKVEIDSEALVAKADGISSV